MKKCQFIHKSDSGVFKIITRRYKIDWRIKSTGSVEVINELGERYEMSLDEFIRTFDTSLKPDKIRRYYDNLASINFKNKHRKNIATNWMRGRYKYGGNELWACEHSKGRRHSKQKNKQKLYDIYTEREQLLELAKTVDEDTFNMLYKHKDNKHKQLSLEERFIEYQLSKQNG